MTDSTSVKHEACCFLLGGRTRVRLFLLLALGLFVTLAAMREDDPETISPERIAPVVADTASAKADDADDAPKPEVLPEPAWQTDLDKALALATSQKRPLLLRFTADWCPPCKVMDRSVFPDPNVKKALAERVVPVILDIDQEQNAELAYRFQVRGVPALILVNSDGEVLARGSFMSAEALVKFLQES